MTLRIKDLPDSEDGKQYTAGKSQQPVTANSNE